MTVPEGHDTEELFGAALRRLHSRTWYRQSVEMYSEKNRIMWAFGCEVGETAPSLYLSPGGFPDIYEKLATTLRSRGAQCFEMAPKLELAFTMRGYMDKENSVDLSTIKSGPSRIIVPITSGFVEGSGLKAELLPGGGDWILTDPETRVSHLDVRTQARTSNGHSLYIHYNGILKANDTVDKVLGFAPDARSTNYGDQEWFATPIIETSDPEFKWVEESVFVGQGHFVVGPTRSAVEYQIYRVVN